MGGTKDYLSGGGFGKTRYQQVGMTANGIKILKRDDAEFPNTPKYSNTPNTMYAARDSRDRRVKQVTIYGGGSDGREKSKDIDIGHGHTNPDGRKFLENEIHVHVWSNGGRSPYARKPSKKERRLLMIARYGKTK